MFGCFILYILIGPMADTRSINRKQYHSNRDKDDLLHMRQRYWERYKYKNHRYYERCKQRHSTYRY